MTPCLPVLTQSLRLKGWANIGTAKKGTYGWVGGRAAKIPGLKLFPGTGIPGNSGKKSQEFPGMPKLLQKCTKNWYFQVKLQIFNELSSFWASGRTYLSIEVHLKEKKNFKNFQIFGKFWWNLRFITMKNSRKFPGTEKKSRELPGTEFYGNSRERSPSI